MTKPSTPCIGICRIEHGNCIGCLRTLPEIAAWGHMSEAERLHIMREVLPARRRRMEAKKMREDVKGIRDEDV